MVDPCHILRLGIYRGRLILFSQDTNSNTPLLPETTPAAQHPAHVPSTSEIMPAEPRPSPTPNHMRLRHLVLPPGHKSFSWFFIILRGMVRIGSKYLVNVLKIMHKRLNEPA